MSREKATVDDVDATGKRVLLERVDHLSIAGAPTSVVACGAIPAELMVVGGGDLGAALADRRAVRA
jgi:hypothetical protein